jgi:hypothetical protein
MERCLVLCARSYSFDDASGKHIEGANLTYLSGDVETGADRRGMEPLTVSAPVEVLAGLVQLPALCELEFRMRPGSKGRPTLSLTSLKVVQSVPFERLFAHTA